MPRDFPDLASLKRCAENWKFRQPDDGESEAEFRQALADFVQPRDVVESMEIRTSKGWNRFDNDDNLDMLDRIERARPRADGGPK